MTGPRRRRYRGRSLEEYGVEFAALLATAAACARDGSMKRCVHSAARRGHC